MIYALLWDHKHGQDISLHKTAKGASNQRVRWMKEALAEWQELSYNDLSDSELVAKWPEITGWTEFFEIRKLNLNP